MIRYRNKRIGVSKLWPCEQFLNIKLLVCLFFILHMICIIGLRFTFYIGHKVVDMGDKEPHIPGIIRQVG